MKLTLGFSLCKRDAGSVGTPVSLRMRFLYGSAANYFASMARLAHVYYHEEGWVRPTLKLVGELCQGSNAQDV